MRLCRSLARQQHPSFAKKFGHHHSGTDVSLEKHEIRLIPQRLRVLPCGALRNALFAGYLNDTAQATILFKLS